MSSKPKLIIIIGPTVSGKSELAVKLAKKFSGEIISADSRQVYRGLDVGTAKVPGKWKASRQARRIVKNTVRVKSRTYIYKGIPHHCVDFVPPKKTYTVAEYKKCAEEAIEAIVSHGKIPIVVGGTGFWIDAIVYDLNLPAVPPNRELRKKLEKKTPAALLKLLKKFDPERAQTIEQKNPRRLIRAIEIAKALGRVPKLKRNSPYDTLWIGLTPSYEALPHKIKGRARDMIRCGLVNETKNLLKKGVSKKRIREFGFEYRAALDYIEKKISKKGLYERLAKDTLAYARRQMTWFKKNREIHWITGQPRRSIQMAQTIVEPFCSFSPRETIVRNPCPAPRTPRSTRRAAPAGAEPAH